MSQSTIGVFLPFLANIPKYRPPGGFKKLKRYVRKAFSKQDTNGSMMLGTVKKIDIVLKEKKANTTPSCVSETNMDCDVDCEDTTYGNTKLNVSVGASKAFMVASAYIRFVPSNSASAKERIDHINSAEGLKFVHNESKELHWNIFRQKKDLEKTNTENEVKNENDNEPKTAVYQVTCPKCEHDFVQKMSAEYAEEIEDMFDRLSCNDGPAKKRIRR